MVIDSILASVILDWSFLSSSSEEPIFDEEQVEVSPEMYY